MLQIFSAQVTLSLLALVLNCKSYANPAIHASQVHDQTFFPPYPPAFSSSSSSSFVRRNANLNHLSGIEEAISSHKKGDGSSSDVVEIISGSTPFRTSKQFPYSPLLEGSSSSSNSQNSQNPLNLAGSIIQFSGGEILLGWRLTIKSVTQPKPSSINNAKLLVKRIDEVLNLTCVMEYVGKVQVRNSQQEGVELGKNLTKNVGEESTLEDLGPDQIFKMAWHLPIMPQNSKNRVSFQDLHNSKHLIVDHLKESDGGEYECTATANDHPGEIHPYQESIQIVVKPKKGSCNEPLVYCSSGECIARRFMCDGKTDCKDKSDESYENCGTYQPCEGKLRCGDGRCLSPYLCCDRTIDKNCTVLIQSPCCSQLKHYPYHVEPHYGLQPHHYNEMTFLQTTIYTVIGCSMAFMFIITIMVIAICRVHLKRTAQLGHLHHRQYAQGPFWDVPFHSGRLGPGTLPPYTATASGLLVTYNINNGVQFVGRPLNPPPYTEQPSLPPREGPPPPYCSVDNLIGSSISEREGFTRDPGLPGYTSNPDHHEPSSSGEARVDEGQRQILSGHEGQGQGQVQGQGQNTGPNNGSESGQERETTAPELEESLAVSQPLLTSGGESSSQ